MSYRQGTISVTNGSKAVVGTSTLFKTVGVTAGDQLYLTDANGLQTGYCYEVESVTDDTHLTLLQNYQGETSSGNNYAIVDMAGDSTVPNFARRLAEFYAQIQTEPSSTVAGLCKLYSALGSNTDGALTQAKATELLNAKADTATTLEGYGITDANINEGVITLGSDTITPLTEHQSLDDYYTKTEVDTQLELKEDTSNKVASISSSSTDTEYPTAKCVYNAILTQGAAKNAEFDWNATDLGTISNSTQAAEFVGDYGVTTGTFGTLKLNQRITIANGAIGGSARSYVIAGFNMYLNVGGSNVITQPHLNLIPTTTAGSAVMNSTNTTSGGYVGSAMHTSTMATLTTNLKSTLGTHLLHGDRLLSSAMTSSLYNRYGSAGGAASSWAWTDTYADLLTENQVYGGIVWSSSGYDTGEGKEQLPIFRFVPTTYFGRFSWWLRAVTNSTAFAFVDNTGGASYNGASGSYGVRPLIHLG